MKYAILICGPESSGTGFINVLFSNNKNYNNNSINCDFYELNAEFSNNHMCKNKNRIYLKNIPNHSYNFDNIKTDEKIKSKQNWNFELKQTTITESDVYYIKHIGIPFANFYPDIEDFSIQLKERNFIVKIIIPIRDFEISTISTINRFKYLNNDALNYKKISKNIINNLLNSELDVNILSYETFMFLGYDYINYFIKNILKIKYEINNKLKIKNANSKYIIKK